jgi:hypothetical protein
MVPVIVPSYAAVLVFVYIALAVRMIRMRRSEKVAVGTGGNARLERAMRVHANFAEYVPLALLLITFLELQRARVADPCALSSSRRGTRCSCLRSVAGAREHQSKNHRRRRHFCRSCGRSCATGNPRIVMPEYILCSTCWGGCL